MTAAAVCCGNDASRDMAAAINAWQSGIDMGILLLARVSGGGDGSRRRRGMASHGPIIDVMASNDVTGAKTRSETSRAAAPSYLCITSRGKPQARRHLSLSNVKLSLRITFICDRQTSTRSRSSCTLCYNRRSGISRHQHLMIRYNSGAAISAA